MGFWGRLVVPLVAGRHISIAKSTNLHSLQKCRVLGAVDDLLLASLLFDSHFWKKRSIAITGAKKVFLCFEDEEDQKREYEKS